MEIKAYLMSGSMKSEDFWDMNLTEKIKRKRINE